jgi:hypothetical protein
MPQIVAQSEISHRARWRSRRKAAPCGWQLQVRHSISPHPLCQLHVDRLNPAPDVEPEVVERLDREHRRRVDKDVAPAVAVVDELRRPAYIVRVAQVDDDVAGAVEDNHRMVEREPRENRAADGTGAAG